MSRRRSVGIRNQTTEPKESMNTPTNYSMKRTLNLDFDDADSRVREALEKEGFGVLTEIDVKETLKKKLDVDFRRYRILGACNPPLAHKALEANGSIGLLLPCNLVVQESERPGQTIVEALDPVVQLGVANDPQLVPLAEEVRERLARVLDAVEKAD